MARPQGADPVTDATQSPPAEEHHKKHSFWRELPVLVVVAFAVALLLKTFVIQAFFIPSASMFPTLDEGDRVLVEKISYAIGAPGRGDVIVFERDIGADETVEEAQWWEKVADSFRGLFGFPTGTTQDFIKRVIAVGGDTVEGRPDGVYVNGELVNEPYLEAGTGTGEFAPVVVSEDQVFVMGDNRGNSDDSRNFGAISEDRIVGHAFVLIWPPTELDTL
jgi:signal peptidase I